MSHRRTDGKTAAETTAGRATSPAETRKDGKPYRVPPNAERAAESHRDGKNAARGVIHKRQTRKSTFLKKTTDPDAVCEKSTQRPFFLWITQKHDHFLTG